MLSLEFWCACKIFFFFLSFSLQIITRKMREKKKTKKQKNLSEMDLMTLKKVINSNQSGPHKTPIDK